MVLPVVLSKAIARNLLRLIRQSRTSMRSPLNVPAWAWAGVAIYQAYQAMVPGVQYIGAAVRLVLRVPRWMWSILVKAWQQAPDEATAGTPKPDRTNGDVAIAASPCDGLSPSEWLVPGVFVRTKVCAARLVVASEVTTDGEGVKGVFTLPWPHGAAASLPGEAPVFQPRAVLVPAEQADVSVFDASLGFASPIVASTPVRTPRDGVPPRMSKLTSSVSSRATPWWDQHAMHDSAQPSGVTPHLAANGPSSGPHSIAEVQEKIARRVLAGDVALAPVQAALVKVASSGLFGGEHTARDFHLAHPSVLDPQVQERHMPLKILYPVALKDVVPVLEVGMPPSQVLAVIGMLSAYGGPDLMEQAASRGCRISEHVPTRTVDTTVLTDRRKLHAALAGIEACTLDSASRCRIWWLWLNRDSQTAVRDLAQFFRENELENPHLATVCEHVWGVLKLAILNAWRDASAARQKVVLKTLEKMLQSNAPALQGKKFPTVYAAVAEVVTLMGELSEPGTKYDLQSTILPHTFQRAIEPTDMAASPHTWDYLKAEEKIAECNRAGMPVTIMMLLSLYRFLATEEVRRASAAQRRGPNVTVAKQVVAAVVGGTYPAAQAHETPLVIPQVLQGKDGNFRIDPDIRKRLLGGDIKSCQRTKYRDTLFLPSQVNNGCRLCGRSHGLDWQHTLRRRDGAKYASVEAWVSDAVMVAMIEYLEAHPQHRLPSHRGVVSQMLMYVRGESSVNPLASIAP